jgi:Sulfotransferase family
VPDLTLQNLECSDVRYLGSRLVQRATLELRAARRPSTLAALARLSAPENQRRMLFVVGAGRSGTTATQVALNTSTEVFLLGEAFFFLENLRPNFRARHNEKHATLGHPPDKESECPAVAPENGTWVETVAALASQYRFVGEKIPFGAYKADRWPIAFLAFHGRYFPGAAYILSFRNPRDAILSVRTSLGIQDLVPWARSYIAAQRALLRLRMAFPRTVPVFLETIGSDTFEAIEQCLDCPIPQLSSVLVRRAASPHAPEQVPPELRETVKDLEALYPTLCDAVSVFGSSRSCSSFHAIDTRLSKLYRRLDPLYYSIGARLTRLYSKAVTASRMARNSLQRTVYR